MVDAWPAGLPQKLEPTGFSEGLGDGLIEYKPDQGPTITRRRTSAVMRSLSGTMMMTVDQIDLLTSFYDVTILGGALPFQFPDQIRDGTLLVRFTKGSPPQWAALSGDIYRVSINLMVLP